METIGINVDLSTKQVESTELLQEVVDALACAGLEPDALTLELTEDLLVGDTSDVDDRLRAISQYGSDLRSTTSEPGTPRCRT